MKNSAWKFLALTLPVLLSAGLLAQTATPIFEFDVNQNGLDGGNPYGSLVQATDGNLYGAMLGGGANQTSTTGGVIFRITPAGQFSVIYSCSAAGTDCNGPVSLLELPDGYLYGVAQEGGASGYGDIFKLTLDGTGFTDLFDFSNSEFGEYPNTGIIFTGSAIIGTTSGSGTAGDFDNSGTIWSFQPDFGVGFSVFENIYGFASNSTLGFQPVNGVTSYNGLLYGATQVGGGSGFNQCGSLFSFNVNSHTPTVLHTFACGTDGGYPDGQPKFYSDGNFYGTTLENGSGPDYGSVWKAGATSGFTALTTFTGGLTNADGTVSFDTAGNIIFNSRKGGSNTYGALYAEKRSGGAPTVLFNFAQQSPEGDTADSAPFFDNAGHMWTEELTGGGTVDGVIDEIGAIVEWNLSTETKAPITISVSPATVLPNATATVTWSANNAFSTDEQYCFATGISGWTGQQTGSYSGGILSGSATIKPATVGTYPLTITCGGTETAIANLTVSTGAVATTTTLAASPTSIATGQNVTLTATVKKSSGTGTPTGKVTFYANGTSLAAVSLNGSGVASLTAPGNYPNGTYAITAKYAGDANDAASSSNTVNVSIKDSSSTALTITPSTVKAGASVTLKATVTSTDGKTPTGSVTFSADGVSLFSANLSAGTVSQSVSTSGYAAGTYTVTAAYGGDSAHAPSSGNATVTLQ